MTLDYMAYVNGGLPALRAASHITLGLMGTLCREYGRDIRQFAYAHPQQWRPVIDADVVRSFLIGE